MSQGAVEQRTGLRRVYISRVENSHVVPWIETLEKFARALELPTYALLDGAENPPAPELPKNLGHGWGSSGRDARTLEKYCRLLSRASKADQQLPLFVVTKMSLRK
jgi:transcriptional regulator with XRE-family HTH domain